MAAANKLVMFVSFLLCLLGAVMILGALGIDKWQSPIPNPLGPDIPGRSGLRVACVDNPFASTGETCGDLPMNTTDCCSDPNVCPGCTARNDNIRARQATLACSAIACILFLCACIVELCGMCGKKHSKKGHGVAALMCFTAIFAFAAIGVYAVQIGNVNTADGTNSVKSANLSDSFNLVGVAGGIACIVAILSCVFLHK